MNSCNELKNKLKYIIKYCRENKKDCFNVDNYNIKIIKGNLLFNDRIYRINQDHVLCYLCYLNEKENKVLIYCIDKIYNILENKELILTDFNKNKELVKKNIKKNKI